MIVINYDFVVFYENSYNIDVFIIFIFKNKQVL